MAQKGLAQVIGHDEETPEAIAAAIDRAMAGPAPDRSAVDIGGARTSARILMALARGEQPPR